MKKTCLLELCMLLGINVAVDACGLVTGVALAWLACGAEAWRGKAAEAPARQRRRAWAAQEASHCGMMMTTENQRMIADLTAKDAAE